MASDPRLEQGGDRTSVRSFWRRAKAVFSEDGSRLQHQDLEKQCNSYEESMENSRNSGQNSNLHKRFEAFTSSLSQFGGSFGNAIEEGLNMVENKASTILSLDRFSRSSQQKKYSKLTVLPTYGEELLYTYQDIVQLKASRDVAIVIANRAKQEAKIAKVELEGIRARCSQLEEENMKLRELVEKGVVTHEEDELVRMQLEALHLEKSQLANENEKYAREVRFLREVMEYHQLSLQDVSVEDEDLNVCEETHDDFTSC